MGELRCLNWHSHPAPTKGCCEGCMMCCGYTTPAVIGILIAGLVIASDVYSIILIARNPHSAWRIIVCLIVFILTTACGVAVSWAYYGIIFTSPGFVPRETWQHPPTYVGPPLPPREQSRGHASNPSPPPPLTQQQQQQSGSPQLAPSMARRSPNHTSDASLPSHGPASPPPAHLPQHTQQQQQQPSTSSPTTSANPLLDCDDGDTRKNTSGDAAVDPVGAVIYSDSVDSGNGRQQRASHTEGAAKPAEEMQDAAEVRNVRHSPYATPNGQMSNVAVPLRPSSASPLNPYQVHSIGPGGALRYCHTCKMYKPDGAHHCRVCERCVFNFDHHCPFVNNCVGRNNYKLFIIFLLYAGVGATLSGGLMAVTLFAVDTAEIMSKIGWVAVPAVDVVLGLALLLFYVQHRVLLCNGESTLESIVRSDDTFNGWRQAWSRPRPTAAERAEKKRQKKLKAERHYRTLLGNESPWWRRYLPFPVRTDDTADATVPGNI